MTEEEKTITIEAVKRRSDRIDNLVTTPSSSHKDSCPLCRLNLRRLNYTVIIYRYIYINKLIDVMIGRSNTEPIRGIKWKTNASKDDRFV